MSLLIHNWTPLPLLAGTTLFKRRRTFTPSLPNNNLTAQFANTRTLSQILNCFQVLNTRISCTFLLQIAYDRRVPASTSTFDFTSREHKHTTCVPKSAHLHTGDFCIHRSSRDSWLEHTSPNVFEHGRIDFRLTVRRSSVRSPLISRSRVHEFPTRF
jgi:hypothetical protein